MLSIGMNGSHLIHTFGYAMHVNHADLTYVNQPTRTSEQHIFDVAALIE